MRAVLLLLATLAVAEARSLSAKNFDKLVLAKVRGLQPARRRRCPCLSFFLKAWSNQSSR